MQGARSYFERALEVAHEPKVVAWSHIYLGRIFDLQEDREAALDHYRAAVTAGRHCQKPRPRLNRDCSSRMSPPAVRSRVRQQIKRTGRIQSDFAQGESMKRAAMLVVILALATFVSAQTQTPPAPAAGTAATTPPPAGQAPAPGQDPGRVRRLQSSGGRAPTPLRWKKRRTISPPSFPTANCGSCCTGPRCTLPDRQQFRQDDGNGTQGAEDRSRRSRGPGGRGPGSGRAHPRDRSGQRSTPGRRHEAGAARAGDGRHRHHRPPGTPQDKSTPTRDFCVPTPTTFWAPSSTRGKSMPTRKAISASPSMPSLPSPIRWRCCAWPSRWTSRTSIRKH